MKELICQILSIKDTTYFLWKKNTHIELIIFLEKVTSKYTTENFSKWIKDNEQSTEYKKVPITNELAKLLNISIKNIYKWRQKKTLLFNLIFELFYHEESYYDIENVFIDIFNYPRDLDNREEEIKFAEIYEKEFIRNIFKICKIPVISKLVAFENQELEIILYIFKILNLRLYENNLSAKSWMKVFLEEENVYDNILSIEQMYNISKLLAHTDNSIVSNTIDDLFREQRTIIRVNIQTLSIQDINYLLLALSFSINSNQNDINKYYIEILKEIKDNNSKTLSLKILDTIDKKLLFKTLNQ